MKCLARLSCILKVMRYRWNVLPAKTKPKSPRRPLLSCVKLAIKFTEFIAKILEHLRDVYRLRTVIETSSHLCELPQQLFSQWVKSPTCRPGQVRQLCLSARFAWTARATWFCSHAPMGRSVSRVPNTLRGIYQWEAITALNVEKKFEILFD